ncbi:MAG: amino acid adenylation domain-containing protein [Flavobacteriales bacterium]|nr:amino acid adenylation domain-containing protein [Flavobacteriales bacterium]
MEKFITETRLVPVDFDPFNGAPIDRTIPSTEAQREVFIASLMGDEASCAYNESVSLELDGALDRIALEGAIANLIRRHEALRGTMSSDGTRVIVQDRNDIRIGSVDLEKLTSDMQHAELDKIAHRDMSMPFDLIKGPVFRIKLIRLSEAKHILRLTGHHVLVDGWSLGIIMADISKLYSGALLEDAVPFSDFALAVIDHAKSEDHVRVEQFWLDQFKGTVPRLDLPTDRLRPQLKTYRGARSDIELNPDLTRKLKELATRNGASLVTTLLTSFELLLSHITGETDIAVGLPAAGQSDFGMKQLVGHCVNLLALRSHIDPNSSFADHLKARRSAVLDATDNQKYTFGTLVRKLNVPREPGRIPLVPAVFNVDMNMDDGVAFSGLQHRFISNPRLYENFELFLNATGSDKHLVLEWSYNTDLFDEATVRGWMSDVQYLIESAHADPTQHISALFAGLKHKANEPMPPAEWSGQPSAYPRVAMDVLFDQMCEQYPERIAVEIGEERITYKELQALSNALAAELVRRGLKHGEPVGLCLERCIGTQTAMLAILKAGGCYVPFDLSYPEERVRYMLQDAQVKFMLTQPQLISELPGCESIAILLNAQGRSTDKPFEASTSPAIAHDAESPAYIMYTSGSTGNPKGVVVPHRGVVRLVRDQNYMTYGPQHTFLQMGNLCFDASTFEIWGALLNGARLVLQPQAKPTLTEVATTLRKHKVTSVLFPTGLFNMLVDEHLHDLRGLKHILSGGDVMSPVHARKALRVLGPGVLVNAYGPTENSVVVTCHAVDKEAQLTGTVPIGKPVSNTEAYILDEAMRPVPIGTIGELYAGGEGVALGYWHRPELTAERFVPDTFSNRPNAKLYRTGDLARWLPDGTIEFAGRADTQVKLRGFRIELGEIEAVMDGTGLLKDRVVVCRTDSPGDKQLVAYLIANDASVPQDEVIDDVREHLRMVLPSHMVPAAFVVLPAFPLNQSGKVDRKALPAPTFMTPVLRAQHVAPRSDVEKQLASIWGDVLGTEDIGVHDNFFDLGGHSLTGIQLLARIEQRLGSVIPLKNLFLAPTIALMAELIQDRTTLPTWTHLLPIQPEGSRVPLFCVHGDEANVFLPKYLGNDQPFYGISHQGDDGKAIRLTTVADMAAHFIKEIRTVRPHGPYLLSGYSFGGIIAYEIAQQLVASGEEVPVLALFDTYDPKEYVAVMKRETRPHQPIKVGIVRRIAQFYFDRGKALPLRLRHTYIIDMYNRAVKNYQVKPYSGRITLLRTAESSGPVDMGWAPLAKGGVEIHEVPGNHYNMVKEPHVAGLARELAQVIEVGLRRSAVEGL